jgi:hypothetical protein
MQINAKKDYWVADLNVVRSDAIIGGDGKNSPVEKFAMAKAGCQETSFGAQFSREKQIS